jgi:hypothetical protein
MLRNWNCAYSQALLGPIPGPLAPTSGSARVGDCSLAMMLMPLIASPGGFQRFVVPLVIAISFRIGSDSDGNRPNSMPETQ